MALPNLPAQGQNPWYTPRTNWDNAVEAELEGRLSEAGLNTSFVRARGSVVHAANLIAPNSASDSTSALQSLISGMSPGGTLVFDTGTWKVNGTLTIPHNDFTVRFESGSAIDRTAGSATVSGFVASGARFRMHGPGEITSPATWDGTNSTWTYAVVLLTGDSPTVEDITLNRVPRIGIGFKDTTGVANVRHVTVLGEYPASQWTEVETMHAGVAFDPGVNSTLNMWLSRVESCVQGYFLGNYGTGSTVGSVVAGNNFRGCHNHAIYVSVGATGVIVGKNIAIDCSRPIAITGDNHIVIGNGLFATGTGGNLHAVCNIHMRNASGAIVSNNKMSGDVFSGGAPAIQISGISGGTTFRKNIVTDNSIEASDTYAAVGISVGTTTGTVDGALVQGNQITARGIANQGVITVFANPGSGTDVRILDNSIRIRGESHGIYVYGNTDADIRGNTIRLEWDAPSAKTLGGVVLSTCTGTRVSQNTISVPADWGSNISFRGVYEVVAATGGQYSRNKFNYNLTKLVSGTPYFIAASSGAIMDEQQPGAPTYAVSPGSQWLRTDGGAGTTLYIKESASSSTAWRAI